MRAAIGLAVLLLAAAVAATAAPDDAYLAGYAAAIVERDFGLHVESVEVKDGVARVIVDELGDQTPEHIADTLLRIEGIDRVEVHEKGEEALLAEAESDGGEKPKASGLELLPRAELFEPLMADPREPRFSVSYLWYLDDPDLDHVGSANLGESFALVAGPLGKARWELGLQGGVFSIFDLDAESKDLVNADYQVGPTLSVRRDALSARLRVFHQSSHLGDEFVLRGRAGERLNLSYEGVDLILSADPWSWLRVYAGGGGIFHTDPDLDPGLVQAGAELESPWTFLYGIVRPVAAFDYSSHQETDWHEELSTVAGLQLENPRLSKLRLQILFEYYKGQSPNGQFFFDRIESLGVGVHLWF